MSNRVTCPHCKIQYSLPQEYEGKAVRCTSCQQPFRVRFSIFDEPSSPPPPAKDPWPQPAAQAPVPPPPEEPIIPDFADDVPIPKSKSSEEVIDIREALAEEVPRPNHRGRTSDDDTSSKPRRRNEDNADDDRPRRRRTKDDDDRDDDRRGRRQRGTTVKYDEGNKGAKIVGGVIGGILVIGLIALKIWGVVGRDRERERPVAQFNQPQPNFNFQNKQIPPFPGVDFQPKQVMPGVGLPPALELPKLQDQKFFIRPTLALPVKPPALKRDGQEFELPKEFSDVCVGGGGRFLIFKSKGLRQVAIFDLVEAKIVKVLPAPSENALVAAGMDSLIMLDPTIHLVERWDLQTFERVDSDIVQTKLPPIAMAMGSSSNGPLLIAAVDGQRQVETIFFDSDDLWKITLADGIRFFELSPGVKLAVSADGTMFTAMNSNDIAPQIAFLKDHKMQKARPGGGGRLPSADAKQSFLQGTVFNDRLEAPWGNLSRPGSEVRFIPAVEGPYYLGIRQKREGGKPVTGELAVHLDDPQKPLGILAEMPAVVELLEGPPNFWPALEKHLYLVPDANLLAVIPKSKDRVILYKVDFDALLAKAETDYLFVSSHPTKAAHFGELYEYALKVKSKPGDVSFRLVSGPPDAKLDKNGQITWKVPKELDVEGSFHIEITNGKRKILHEIKIPVWEKIDRPINAPKLESAAWVPLTVTPASQSLPAGLKPPKLPKEQVAIKLNAPVQNFTLGGNGRYFILHLPKEKRLDIFDLNVLKVVKSLPLESNNVLIAGGLDRLMVVYPTEKRIERWSLTTFQKEQSEVVPYAGIESVAMGHAANGRLALHASGVQTNRSVVLLNTDTIKNGITRVSLIRNASTHALRAAADGETFTGADNLNGTPSPIYQIKKTEDAFSMAAGGTGAPGNASPDGTVIYSVFGRNQYDQDLKLLTTRGTNAQGSCFIPAEQGRYYLEIDAGQVVNRRENKAPAKVTVYRQGTVSPLGVLPPSTFILADRIPEEGDAIPADRCIRFIPDAKVIVVLGTDRQTLEVTAFDPSVAMGSELSVLNEQVTQAAIGTRYQTRLKVHSNHDGVKAKIDVGPPDMKILEDGRITWDIPKDYDDVDEDIVIRLTDSTGIERFYQFTIRIK